MNQGWHNGPSIDTWYLTVLCATNGPPKKGTTGFSRFESSGIIIKEKSWFVPKSIDSVTWCVKIGNRDEPSLPTGLTGTIQVLSSMRVATTCPRTEGVEQLATAELGSYDHVMG